MSQEAGASKKYIVLDIFERVVLLGMFLSLCLRVFDNFDDSYYNIIFLISEATVALFVIMRRTTNLVSVRPLEWIVAFAGTALPLMIVPNGQGSASFVLFIVLGMAISIGAKLSLRRSFGVVAANRGVKVSGLYAMVRHPMYLGYFLVMFGVVMYNPSYWNFGLIFVWFFFQIMRVHYEEGLLVRDGKYADYKTKVRYRILPLVY